MINAEGGGALTDIGLVFPNGAHSMPLVEADLDTPLAQAALVAKGSALGTASILVLDRKACPASLLESIARFFERESCGQCPPCVLGTTNLRQLVTGERPPTIRLTPHTSIRETASFMAMHGYCTHSRAGAATVSGLFLRFEAQVMEALRAGSEPPQAIRRDPFRPGSTERGALELFLAGC